MKKLFSLLLRRLSLQRIDSHPHLSKSSYICHHRPGLIGDLLRAYCRMLKFLGLGRDACIRIATYDRLRPFKSIPGGVKLEGAPTAKVPVVLLEAHELTNKQLLELVEVVASEQEAGIRFRPLFILSSTNFKPFREYGYMFEYLPTEDLWSRADLGQNYQDFINMRLVSVLEAYAPDRTIHVNSRNIANLKPINWLGKKH